MGSKENTAPEFDQLASVHTKYTKEKSRRHSLFDEFDPLYAQALSCLSRTSDELLKEERTIDRSGALGGGSPAERGVPTKLKKVDNEAYTLNNSPSLRVSEDHSSKKGPLLDITMTMSDSVTHEQQQQNHFNVDDIFSINHTLDIDKRTEEEQETGRFQRQDDLSDRSSDEGDIYSKPSSRESELTRHSFGKGDRSSDGSASRAFNYAGSSIHTIADCASYRSTAQSHTFICQGAGQSSSMCAASPPAPVFSVERPVVEVSGPSLNLDLTQVMSDGNHSTKNDGNVTLDVCYVEEDDASGSTLKYTEIMRENEELRNVIIFYEQLMHKIEAYIDTINSQDNEKLVTMEKEKNALLDDHKSLENSFSDLHRRYEKLRVSAVALQENEKMLLANNSELREALQIGEARLIEFSNHVEERMNQASEEIQMIKAASEQECSRMQAALKFEQIKVSGLEKSVLDLTKQKEELTKICDELLGNIEE